MLKIKFAAVTAYVVSRRFIWGLKKKSIKKLFRSAVENLEKTYIYWG